MICYSIKLFTKGNRCFYVFANPGTTNRLEFLQFDLLPSNFKFDFFINRLNLPEFRFSHLSYYLFLLHEFWFGVLIYFFTFLQVEKLKFHCDV